MNPVLSAAIALAVSFASATAFAGNAAEPAADPVMEKPTMLCLGMHWIVKGDDNKNAVINVEYQKKGETAWQRGPDLFRVMMVDSGKYKNPNVLKVQSDQTLFAGSVVLLQPDTEYTVKLTLNDPDGSKIEKTLTGKTRGEPVYPNGPVIHVAPGNGGGDGTQANPIKGLAAAQEKAAPGTTLLLHAGTYEGQVKVTKNGEEGKPIVWKAAADGEVIIDGKGAKGRIIDAGGINDVWFNGLTIRNGEYGMVAHESARLVVQRCNFRDVEYGLTATRNSNDKVNDYFISDNVMQGPSTWPRTQGIESARGVQVTGSGHVVCYNTIRGFADAVDTFQNGPRCENIDFHNNDVSELTDDGFEMDYSQRNTRLFHNRMTNVFQGMSVQPVFGGPVYIFRNVMYNVGLEPFKMHNVPNGAIFYHNTVVKCDFPTAVLTSEKMINCVWRNNLFIGTEPKSSNYALECIAKAENCDFDYCGFGGGPYKMFLKWNNQKYATFEEMKKSAPVFKHAIQVTPAKTFASGALPPAKTEDQVKTPPDLRLSKDSEAIDAGEPIPGFTNNFAGKAPDLGAYELGAELPHYGVRPVKK